MVIDERMVDSFLCNDGVVSRELPGPVESWLGMHSLAEEQNKTDYPVRR